MANVADLKERINELSSLLNLLIESKRENCCNHEILLDLSRKLDFLIVEYIKNERKGGRHVEV